jgi:ribosomal protein L14E/L6E/L27E
MTVKITAYTYCNHTEEYCLHPNTDLNETHVSCGDVIDYQKKIYTCSCLSTSCSITENCNKIYEFDEECRSPYNSMGNDVMIPFMVVLFIGLLFCCMKGYKRTYYPTDRYGNQHATNLFGHRIHNEVRRRPHRKTVLRLTTYTLDDIELVDDEEISENRECVICLDKLKEESKEEEEKQEKQEKQEEKEKDKNKRQIAKLKCNHYFHKKCISHWFDQKPDCPICRGTVVIDEETVEITI